MRLADVSREISEVVREAAASVVTIFTRRAAYDEFLRPVPVTGAGSGFAVTNFHVVSGAREVDVLLPGGGRSRGCWSPAAGGGTWPSSRCWPGA